MMSKRFLLALFLCMPVFCWGQCKYTWYRTEDTWKVCSDTITTTKPYCTTSASDTSVTNFEALIAQIKIPPFDEGTLAYNRALIDTLSKIGSDSAKKEIEFIENELNSGFQVLEESNIAYALYSIDTFKHEDKRIVVYTFSTSFWKEWNEDFDNWIIYYTREFGVLLTYEINFSLSATSRFLLVDSCMISGQDRNTVNELLDYVQKKGLN